MKICTNQGVNLSYVRFFFSYLIHFPSGLFFERKNYGLMHGTRRLLRGYCLISALGSIVLSFTPNSEAATYYVSSNGSDSNPGTSSLPFDTIKKGISALKSGDTLIIRAGTYTEGLEYYNPVPSGLDDAHRTVIKAAPGEIVIINGRNSNGDVWTIYDRSYITIDGITIDGGNALYYGFRIGRRISGTPGSHYITVQNGTVRNTKYSGIFHQGVGGVNSYHRFVNLDVHHCGTGTTNQHHGIYFKARNSLIELCRIHDNLSYGIQLYDGNGGVNNNIIRNNRVYSNGSFGILLSAGYNNLAYNNIVWGNGKRVSSGGIFASYAGVKGSKIYNNTLYRNSGYCIWIRTDGSAKAINNICWQNSTNAILDETKTATVSRNLFTDPYFTDPYQLNFSLLSNSPAIDKGITLSEVPRDFIGVSRPQGGIYDAGAYEKSQ